MKVFHQIFANKTVLISVIFGLFLIIGSCTKQEKQNSRDEIFNLILNDRLALENNLFILDWSNEGIEIPQDSIFIKDITLLGKSSVDFELYTIEDEIALRIFTNFFQIKEGRTFSNPDTILKQIEKSSSRRWNVNTETQKVKIDTIINEVDVTLSDSDNSYLIISEPIEDNGVALIATFLTNGKYILDKYYFVEKDTKKWKIAGCRTAVCKIHTKRSERNNQENDTTTQTVIFVGYNKL